MEKYIVEVCENVTYWHNESGQLHRLGGKPALEYADGGKVYYENGERHRLGGLPAIEYADGSKEYWENGKCHRLGGKPAIEWADSSKAYYENGIQLTEAEAEAKRNPKADPCDGKLVTIEGKQYKLTAL